MFSYEPKVSIVIPAYNASNYLAEAIDSALAQTYKNIEIIVVNDGSKDDGATAKVALSYGDKIRYFEKENGGSSSAMNLGIRMMTGDWFSWLSHDDLYYPNKIFEELKYINSLNINFEDADELQSHLVFASADLINESGKIIKKFSKKEIAKASAKINAVDGNIRLIAEPIQSGFHGCSCLIHKKAFEKIGLFDENLRLLNDMDLWFRFYSKGYKIHYLPMTLVKGRVHAKQVSRSIGYSYHNPEQDVFWNQNLTWLEKNYPESYDYFVLYAKTAYDKTRYVEGKKAFNDALKLKPNRFFLLRTAQLLLFVKSKCKEILKRIYIKIKL